MQKWLFNRSPDVGWKAPSHLWSSVSVSGPFVWESPESVLKRKIPIQTDSESAGEGPGNLDFRQFCCKAVFEDRRTTDVGQPLHFFF